MNLAPAIHDALGLFLSCLAAAGRRDCPVVSRADLRRVGNGVMPTVFLQIRNRVADPRNTAFFRLWTGPIGLTGCRIEIAVGAADVTIVPAAITRDQSSHGQFAAENPAALIGVIAIRQEQIR